MSDMTRNLQLRAASLKTIVIPAIFSLLTIFFHLTVFFLLWCPLDAEAGIKRRSSRTRKRTSSENSVYQKKQNLKNLLNKNNGESIAGDAHYELGMLYMLTEDYDQALGHLNNAVGGSNLARGKRATSYYYLSGIYMKRGQRDEARKTLEKLIQELPGNAYYDMGLDKLKSIYRQEGETSSVMPYIKTQGYYSVQVGSYTKKDNAERVVNQLKNRYMVSMSKIFKGQKVFWRVRVGEYSRRADASKIALEIKKREGFPAVVVP